MERKMVDFVSCSGLMCSVILKLLKESSENYHDNFCYTKKAERGF